MKQVVRMIVCLLLLASCGSVNKAVKQDVERTTVTESSTVTSSQTNTETSSGTLSVTETTLHEQTDDSTETVTIKETTWYDTSKADSNGVSPVLRKETVTSTTRHGKRTNKGSEEKNNTEDKSQSSTTTKNSATKEESAESALRSKTEKETSMTETKQFAYLSQVLYGLAFCILMAILAYWVFSKYRQRRRDS